MAGLVGRSEEAAWLARSIRPDGPPVVIVFGLAGVGKSFLLDHLADVADESGWRVERIFGSPAARDIPLGAASHLLAGVGDDGHDALFRMARMELARRARGAPLLLLIDDLHELDAWTAALVDQVAAHGDAHIAAVAREGASSPAVETLSTRAGAETFLLDPLPRDASDVLVQAVLGGPCTDDLLDAVWEKCFGHPLYVETVLGEARRARAVHLDQGRWALGAPIEVGQLGPLMAARLERVRADDLAAAHFVAVAGPLPLDLVLDLVPPSSVRQLVHHGVLARRWIEGTETVMAAHPMYAEACLEQLSTSRTAEICRMLVDAITSGTPVVDIDVVRLGTLMLQSGDVHQELAVRAGNEALRRGDLALAEALARAATDSQPGSVPAHIVLARALAYGGRGNDALATLDLARPLDPAASASVALVRGDVLAFGLGRPGDAIRLLEQVADELPQELRSGLDGARSLYGALAGDFDAAIAAASQVLGNDDADDDVRLGAYVNLTVARTVRGDLAGIDDQLEAAEALVQALDLPHPLASDQLSGTGFNTLVAQGRLGEARRRAAALPPDASPLLLTWAGVALGMAGQRRAAIDLHERAVEVFATADPLRLAAQAQALLVMHRAQDGAVDRESRSLLAAAGQAAGDETRLRCWVQRAEVWCAAAQGRSAEAVDLAMASGTDAISRDHVVWGIWILHDAVRLGAAALVVEALEDAVGQTTGADLLIAMRDHAFALHAALADEAAAVAHRFASLGSPLLASETAIQSALLHVDARDDEAARRSALLAALWHDRCDGVPRPDDSAVPDPLTARQVEIATYVSTGATSQAVAEALFLSVRTVDNHLRAIYGKLGLRSRDELGALVRSAG